jgi:uncharacterized protein YjiS (DUF1127 family)
MKYATSEAFEFTDPDKSSTSTTPTLTTKFFTLVSTWRKRSKKRAQLASISSHTLRDIGITRFEAMIESDKPFWEE